MVIGETIYEECSVNKNWACVQKTMAKILTDTEHRLYKACLWVWRRLTADSYIEASQVY